MGPVALAGPSVDHADSVEKPCLNAFAGLALRQPGARPPSLEDVAAYMSLFEGLLQFVVLPDCAPKASLSIADWCRFVSTTVPATLRRFCPMWWLTYPKLVFTQRFNGRDLMPMTAPAFAPTNFGLLPNGQDVVAAPVAAQLASEMRYCLQGAQAFFLDLTGQHDQRVWHSHADHVPLSVRDSATYLWWLPELLCIDYSKFDQGVGATFWAPRLEALSVVTSTRPNVCRPSIGRRPAEWKRNTNVWYCTGQT